MKNRPKSWKAVRQERRKENFVGRAEHLRPFLENFTGETPSYMVFAVTGEGGVGKSTLLRQFTHMVTLPNINAGVVVCDDRYMSPAAAMGYVAGELARLEITHKEFDERYKKYRELREEIETDPKAPRGAIDLLARGMTDLAIKSGRKIPGVSVVFEGADEKAAGETVAQGVHYLLSRWTNKDEVILLRETDRVLTPLFLRLLAQACVKGRVVLMFDMFERTGPLLSPWLLSLFNFEYGEFDTNLSFVIAGRDPLEQHWTELAGDICHIALEPFTLEETRLYLGNQGIFDDPLVRLIDEDTGGLPVLVELLAATKPQPGAPLPDVSKDAVERFLQWIPQEDRRRVALLAAVPRQFNRDILSTALGDDATDTFQWLSGQSFVRRKAERGYVYHEKVRELMLRHLRNTIPKDSDETHSRLADYFAQEQAALNLEGELAYQSETWRRLEGERVYHILSAQPERNSHEAVNAFLHAFRWRWGFAEEIARAGQQCGQEKGLQTIRELAGALSDIYRAYDQHEYHMGIEKLGSLERHNALTDIARCEIHALRGRMFRSNGKHDQALADFNRAVELDPSDAWAVAERGRTYRLMGRHKEALADLDRALGLDPSDAWAIISRGLTYQAMGRHEEALADFSRAVALDPSDAWAITGRGLIYQAMGRHEEARADFNRALVLDPSNAWAIARRGLTYRLMERHEEALVEYQRVIKLDSNNSHHRVGLAACCRVLGLMDEYYRQIAIARELVVKEHDYHRACFAAICGENDDALALLRMALEKEEMPLAWAERDPDFDSLRSDPRFAALIEEMRARFATGSM